MTLDSPITIRQKFHVARPSRGILLREGEAPERIQKGTVAPVSRPAKLLALAHHLQELIDRGEVKNQAELARQNGLTRARLTQILNLLHLAPDIQHAIFEGEGNTASEHVLRHVAREVEWSRQVEIWRDLLADHGVTTVD